MDIALVHGAYHGAWCWERLRPELERRGHRVVTMDLPTPDPQQGAADYAGAVEAALDAMPNPAGPPVLVGHSMAGLVIPIVATHRPVHRLVFLTAFLPRPGVSANEQRAEEPIDGRYPLASAEWTDLGDDVWLVGPRTARELFFHDAPREVARWATERLRAQAYRVMAEPTPLAAWPDVPMSSIVCADDRAVNPDWVRRVASDRLGVEAIELPGGHDPFLSRPAELARTIDSLL